MSQPIDRRTFLAGALAVGAAACSGDSDGDPTTPGSGAASSTAPTSSTGPATTSTVLPATPPPTTIATVADPQKVPGVGDGLFRLGVASGDPLPGSVVLWTRLAPEPLDGGGMPNVDVPLRWQVADDERFRSIVASGIVTTRPDEAHSAHVDVVGLRPRREYFYRFTTGGEASPVGRTRTAPAAESSPRQLRLVFASCQDWQDGYWTAWPHIVDEDPDVVLWLGDYIYEGGIGEDVVRPHNSGEVMSLAQYRNRWALYKGDPLLQAAHAAAPWIVTWDDHEVEDNYAGRFPKDPADAAIFRQRRAVAYRAAWEHQPIRGGRPTGPSLRIYRSLSWGRLAELFVLDGRQYRSDQPCGGDSDLGEGCAQRTSPSRTMLGMEQRRWLNRRLERSDGRWSVLANQTVLTPIPFGPLFNLDQWDGYAHERDAVVDMLRRRRNAVVLTGDIHAAGVGTLGVDAERNRPAGTEFVGTSISSPFVEGLEDVVAELVEDLPQGKWFDARHRGYGLCTVTPRQWTTDHRIVSTVTQRRATVSTNSSWAVRDKVPGAEQV